jgi:hypothetical protein
MTLPISMDASFVLASINGRWQNKIQDFPFVSVIP